MPQLNPLQSFRAFGKVAFHDGKRGGTASLEWQQSLQQYSILLMGALGIGSLQVSGTPGHVTMVTSDGQTTEASTPEALIRQKLGWLIPVSPMQYWLKGLGAPGEAPIREEFDAANRLAVLEQQGWKISYVTYMNIAGIEVPEKLMLENGPIKLRFIFRKWEF